MKFLNKILFLIYLINPIISICEEGCLKCSKLNFCEICDSINFYYVGKSGCVKSEIENCYILDQSNNCLQCKENHYLDTATLKCLEQTDNFSIENCEFYFSREICNRCQAGYALLSNRCVKLEKKLDNCELPIDSEHCQICSLGYTASHDRTKCLQNSSAPNCLVHTSVECFQCADNTMMTPNIYQIEWLQKNEFQKMQLVYKQSTSIEQQLVVNYCQELIIQNCSVYSDFQTCQKCSSNYYLENNVCVPYPKDYIPNCEKYLQYDKCHKCQKEYHLTSDGGCQEDENIEFCSFYNRDAVDKTECLFCSSGYYLKDQICAKRQLDIIQNCKQLKTDEEVCDECETGYSLVSTKDKCLLNIQNCLKYEASTSEDKSLVCYQCTEGFYLNDNKICQVGILSNCLEYERTEEICKKCINKYFLDHNKNCVEHLNVQYCDSYDDDRQNICNQCKELRVAFEVNNVCAEAVLKEGCILYSDKDTCAECQQGYYLKDNQCRKIELGKNCLQGLINDQGIFHCERCKQNYLLQDGECMFIPKLFAQNCEQNNLQDGIKQFQNFKCKQCSSNSLPTNIFNSFQCIERNWFKKFAQKQQITQNIPSNCLRVILQEQMLLCVKCEQGYYLNDNICVEVCSDDGIIQKMYIQDQNTNLFYDKSFSCVKRLNQDNSPNPLYIENCKYYSIDENYSNDYKCSYCKDNYLNVIFEDNTKPYYISPINPSQNYIKNQKPDNNNQINTKTLFNSFPKVKACISASTSDFDTNKTKIYTGTNQNQPIENCEYYKEYPNYPEDPQIPKLLGCIKCKIGFIGYTKKYVYNSSNNFQGLVVECVEERSCIKQFVPGLKGYLNTIVSCYECETGKIPHIFMQAGQPYIQFKNFISYDLQLNWPYLSDKKSKSVQCLDPNDNLILQKVNKESNLPKNCALVGVNLEQTDFNFEDATKTENVNKNKIAIVCLSCARGFKPIYGLDTSNQQIEMIGKCEPIDNCLVSSWYNNCSKCKQGYSFPLIKGVSYQIDYQQCVLSNINNCFIFDQSLGVCHKCQAGYQFNTFQQCELVKSNVCQNYSQIFTQGQSYNNTQQVNIFLQIDDFLNGCGQCQDQYIAIQWNFSSYNKYICRNSLHNENQNNQSSNFIDNCDNYNVLSVNSVQQIRCSQCEQGYVLKSTNDECYENKQLKNCILASSEDSCIECYSSHVVVQGKCQLKNIENCKIYQNNDEDNDQKCLECEDGYYIYDQKCLEGTIVDCQQYEDGENKCKQCKEGFHLVTNYRLETYCYPLDERLNCSSFDHTKFSSQIYSCEICSQEKPYYISTDLQTTTVSLCSLFKTLPNCDIYDFSSDSLAGSSFMCKKCYSGYFVNLNGFCQERTISDFNCSEYDDKADKCAICKNNYFLPDNENKCQPNPSGLQGCRIYRDSNTCISCNKNLYLKGEICEKVPNLIENCLYYHDELTCQECDVGHLLESNYCIKAIAQNCKTYASINACDTCYEMRGLKKEDDAINCVLNEDSNCQEFSLQYPFTCFKCFPNFYIAEDNGRCESVTNKIPNCLIYKNKNECAQCDSKSILTLDKRCSKINRDKYDEFCTDLQEIQNPVCYACKGGYLLDSNRNCYECKAVGCFMCDFKDPTICQLCKPGFYMNTTQQCTQYIQEQQEVVEQVAFDKYYIISIFIGILYFV